MNLRSAVLLAGILGLSSGLALAQTDTIINAGDESTVDTSTGTLTVKSVNAPKDGFLVVHVVTDGKPGAVIGHAEVKEGENSGVPVILDTTPKTGDELALMLHDDTGTAGKYEFGMDGSKEDAPTMADGKPVMVTVTVK
jgi:hypothetical protein